MESIFDILNIPFGYLIKLIYSGIPNYAIALFIFAVIVKVILFPFGIKQQKNMVKQASLRPKEAAIRKRYAGRNDKVTQQKLNEEIMALYQKENFNPMGGCLPLLLQFPILISLYEVIRNPLRYICGISSSVIQSVNEKIVELCSKAAISLEGVPANIVSKFASADTVKAATGMDTAIVLRKVGVEPFGDLLPAGFQTSEIPKFTVFGDRLDLGLTPSFQEFGWLLLIPVLTFVIVFLSMRLTKKMSYQPQQTADMKTSNLIMDLSMPLLSVWITFTVPAMVGLYWIYQNILSTLQQFILVKMYPYPTFTDEEMKQVEKEMNSNITKKKVRSLHRIDEEDIKEAEEKAKAAGKEAASEEKAQLNGEPIIEKAHLKDDEK